MIVNNSYFNHNINGLLFTGTAIVETAQVNNSLFSYNVNGLVLKKLVSAAINYCGFSNNSTNGFLLDDMDSGGMIVTVNHCDFITNAMGLFCHMHFLTVNHCNFLYNTGGFGGFGYLSHYDTFKNITKNSTFSFNTMGFADGLGFMLVDSCCVLKNQMGMYSPYTSRIKNCTIDSNTVVGINSGNDSIGNCTIKYNGRGIIIGGASKIIGNNIEYNTIDNINCIGVSATITENNISFGNVGINDSVATILTITKNRIENNNIGVYLVSPTATISCNEFCSNVTYNLKYVATGNLNADNNYWCTTDSTAISSLVYDGYDNISYGLVDFMPLDASCYLTIPGITTTGINEATPTFSFNIFPNPATDYLTLELPTNVSKASVSIFNTIGDLEYSSAITNQKTDIDVSSFANGIYFIQLTNGNNVSRKKFIKQ